MTSSSGLDSLGADPDISRPRPLISSTVAAILGAIAGGLLFVPNPVLGVFMGAGLTGGAVTMWNGGTLRDASFSAGFAAAGYGISRLWAVSPIFGFIGGTALGELAIQHSNGQRGGGHLLAGIHNDG